MAKQTWVNIGGTWRKVKSAWVNIGGTWKKDVMPKGIVSGGYKEFMSYGNFLYLLYITPRTGYDDFEIKICTIDSDGNEINRSFAVARTYPTGGGIDDMHIDENGNCYVTPIGVATNEGRLRKYSPDLKLIYSRNYSAGNAYKIATHDADGSIFALIGTKIHKLNSDANIVDEIFTGVYASALGVYNDKLYYVKGSSSFMVSQVNMSDYSENWYSSGVYRGTAMKVNKYNGFSFQYGTPSSGVPPYYLHVRDEKGRTVWDRTINGGRENTSGYAWDEQYIYYQTSRGGTVTIVKARQSDGVVVKEHSSTTIEPYAMSMTVDSAGGFLYIRDYLGDLYQFTLDLEFVWSAQTYRHSSYYFRDKPTALYIRTKTGGN